MAFRSCEAYQKRYVAFGEALKHYYDAEGELNGLEGLMLQAYSMAKFLRKSNNVIISHVTAIPRPIDTAIMQAVEIMDEPIEYCVPLYKEADALDELSFSAYMILKKAGEIIYCRHCKEFLTQTCRKHKPASSVVGMFYCRGCKGFIQSLCVVHGAEMCDDG